MWYRRNRFWLFQAVLTLPFNGSASLPTHYTAVDIGSIGGSVTTARALNDSGQVTGTAYLDNNGGPYHAFFYSGGVIHDLGTFGGGVSDGYGINDRGDVVGHAQLPTEYFHAFIYTHGTMEDCGTLGGFGSTANAINNSGLAVGSSVPASNTGGVPAIFTNGMAFPLTVLPQNAGPNALNESGWMAGGLSVGSHTHAFLYNGTSTTDLGALGGSDSVGNAITSLGDVAGNFWPASSSLPHAFLYSAGVMHDLGTLGGRYSEGHGMNNAGQVVGLSEVSVGQERAVLWSNGAALDLNGLLDTSIGTTLYMAADINNVGQIVAVGNNNHSYLLTPIPEPAFPSLVLSGGFSALWTWLRRNRN